MQFSEIRLAEKIDIIHKIVPILHYEKLLWIIVISMDGEFSSIFERNFYLDDIVKSLCTVDEATEVIHKVKELCYCNSIVTRMKDENIQKRLMF